MIANYNGHNLSLQHMRSHFWPSNKPLAAKDIMSIANQLDLTCRALRLELSEIQNLRTPCILHWDLNHYVILENVKKQKLSIVDPNVGRRTMVLSEANSSFTGIALEFQRALAFSPTKASNPISIFGLCKQLKPLSSSLLHIFLISLCVEALSLSIPFVSQWIIDGALVANDRDFLSISVLGGILLIAFKFILSVNSETLRLRLSQTVGLQWSTTLFMHLSCLPWEYYQAHPQGEIQSRFSALKPIKDFLLNSLTIAAIDLLTVSACLTLMFLYSTTLTIAALISCLFYTLVRFAFYPILRDAISERIALGAQEQSHFLESLKSSVSIKMSGLIPSRVNQWSNLLVEVQNRDSRTQKIQIYAAGANTLVFGIDSMALLFIGGTLIINSTFTLGMLIAFIGIKAHFTSRITRFIDTFIQYQLHSVNCERVASIALESKEEFSTAQRELPAGPLSVEMLDVSYRHHGCENWILKQVNLTVLAGQSIAITGKSGSGKSTLAKLMLGLIKPSEGRIIIGGIPIDEVGHTQLRAAIGTILQEDQIISGTVAENISSFHPSPLFECIETAAKLANIHHIISKLPFGYQTPITDVCASLSAGQKQRIFLARVFYKKPNLMILDEATSNLDLHSEDHVIQSLKLHPATLVTIAHRKETLKSASRIIKLEGGRIISDQEQ